ncbi:PD-(D/E)XK nuclease-like domain-containing protein [Ferrimonas kyonanensis]|uniref:PD-(D/E)XK nuclease-like domain-containing protein n=1 Tax=Ferrimonas kyonanensis TaxID=364763 RepID=UPI00146C1ECE|nr:PD-(D/E)XK nuclease-like domain-containing protein [Ferrimonas kyonanensis]
MTAMPSVTLVDPNPIAGIANVDTSIEWWNMAKPAYDDCGDPNFLDEDGDLIEGIYFDMPNEVYHSLKAHSSTGFKKFAKSGAHYAREYVYTELKKAITKVQQRTFDTGSVTHAMILEPHNVDSQFTPRIEADDVDGCLVTQADLKKKCEELGLAVSGTKEELAKRLLNADPNVKILAVLQAQQEEYAKAKGLQVVDKVVFQKATRATKTVQAEPAATFLIDHSMGFAEVSFIARCPKTGLMLKCRFDWLDKRRFATDVKTAADASDRKVFFQMRDLRYDLQQVHYSYVASLCGVPLALFAFCYVEFEAADICEVYDLHPLSVKKAEAEYHAMLPQFASALETQVFDGYTPKGTVTTIML